MTDNTKLAELLAAKKEAAAAYPDPYEQMAEQEGQLEHKDPAELTQAKAEAPAPSAMPAYLPVRLQQIIRKDGTVFKPSQGYFIPTTQEEKDLCEYYLSVGRLRKDEE